MAARMVILSGPQQGQTLLVPADTTVVGGDPEKGVLLEPGGEARNIDQGATLACAADGWQIEALGGASVWVNETPLARKTVLLSGDIVRLSHQGPDFVFEVDPPAGSTPSAVGAAAPEPAHRPTERDATPAPGTTPTGPSVAAAVAPVVPVKTGARPRSGRRKSGPMLVLLNVVGIALGGAGGIALMLFILHFALGKDPFGLWEEEPVPVPIASSGPDTAPQPEVAEREPIVAEQSGPAPVAPAPEPPPAPKPAPVDPPTPDTETEPVVVPPPPTDAVFRVDAVYLVTVQELRNNTLFPFCSACAIGNGRLLTSGHAVVELQQLLATRHDGDDAYRVFVSRNGDIQQREPVQRLFAHRVFVDPNQSPESGIYFDFGLLEIAGKERTRLEPQDNAAPAAFEPSKPLQVQLMGFSHHGEPATRFQDADLVSQSLRVLQVTRDESTADRQRAGRLLHLHGLAGDNLAGSPILNDTGQLVALYSTAADVSRNADLKQLAGQLHFAPTVAAIADWFGETLPATAVELQAADTQ